MAILMPYRHGKWQKNAPLRISLFKVSKESRNHFESSLRWNILEHSRTPTHPPAPVDVGPGLPPGPALQPDSGASPHLHGNELFF